MGNETRPMDADDLMVVSKTTRAVLYGALAGRLGRDPLMGEVMAVVAHIAAMGVAGAEDPASSERLLIEAITGMRRENEIEAAARQTGRAWGQA